MRIIRKQINFLRNLLAFISSIPISQIYARFYLSAKRYFLYFIVNLVLFKSLKKPQKHNLKVKNTLPKPIFKRREKSVISIEPLELCFLNNSIKFGSSIDWHKTELKKGTRLWLLNLHYMEFLEGLNSEQAIKYMINWIDENPKFGKEYWMDSWNSYALSIRVVVWMQILADREYNIDDESYQKIISSIYEQIIFLRNNLELDIKGNHLIKNIKALLWASAFFNEKFSDELYDQGVKLLKQELSEQILDDGMHFELSPSYHCQVFADLLECSVVLREDQDQNLLKEKLSKMADCLNALTHSDNKISLFGDGGIDMAYSPEECINVYLKVFKSKPKLDNIINLTSSGYYGFKDSNDTFLFDAGPFAPKSLPAHGHADALSFELTIDKKRVFVDPGVFTYNNGDLRRYSRATTSHNTLSINGLDQTFMWSSFRAGRQAKITKIKSLIKNQFHITAEHDGYNFLKGSPIHRREVNFSNSELTIIDSVKGDFEGVASAVFQIAPNFKAENINENEISIYDDNTRIRFLSSSYIPILDM